MFSGLRLRLTALYLGAALLVLALVSGAAYGLLRAAFQSTIVMASYPRPMGRAVHAGPARPIA
jgi:hypothetical protein